MSTPVPPKPVPAEEAGILDKLHEAATYFSPYFTAISMAATVINTYVSYNQNKEIIKQLRVISKKLDQVIKTLTDIKVLMEVKFEQLQTFPLIATIQTTEDYLDKTASIPREVLINRLYEISDEAREVMLLGFAHFDILAKAFLLEMLLCKMTETDSTDAKLRYREYFLKCLNPAKDGSLTSRLNIQKTGIAILENNYKSGSYIDRQYKEKGEAHYTNYMRDTITVSGDLINGFNYTRSTEIIGKENNPPERRNEVGQKRIESFGNLDNEIEKRFEDARKIWKDRMEISDFIQLNIDRAKMLTGLTEGGI